MNGFNLPPGVSTREIDNLCANPDEDRMGNEEDCTLCHRAFVQDSFDRRYYYADDVELYGFRNLSYSKSIDPFEIPGGKVCSPDCWDEICALNEDEPIPARPVLHLVKGRTA